MAHIPSITSHIMRRILVAIPTAIPVEPFTNKFEIVMAKRQVPANGHRS